MKHKLLPALAIAGLSMAPMAPSALAADPILIKFTHVVTPNTPKGRASLKFKELAEKYTNGKVKVEVYPNSQLYKDKEELEALQIGAVQMAAPSTSKFAPLGVKEFEVLDLPYMFPDQAAFERVTQGPIGQEMLAKLEGKNIKGLAVWINGTYVVSGNKLILKPSDMRGVKNRIQGSKILQAQWKQLGALPQVMAFSEVYQALQSGVVDAMDNVWSNYYTQKLYEVQKHITTTNHGMLGYGVVINKKFWDGLPDDVRAALTKAMAEATKFHNEIAAQENADAKAAIIKTGKTTIHELTDAQRIEWVKALAPIHKLMERRIGADTIAKVQKAAGYKGL